jgi:hypothetical protein
MQYWLDQFNAFNAEIESFSQEGNRLKSNHLSRWLENDLFHREDDNPM